MALDNEYGVDINNKFAFLMDDENDPDETIAEAAVRAAEDKKRAEIELVRAKKAALKKPLGTKVVKVEERRDGKENRGPADGRRGGRGGTRPFGARGGRGGAGGNFRDREPRPAHTNAEDGVARDEQRGARGGQAFGGRGRRGRTDRQSGSDRTGVKPHEKRGGAGRGNWGTPEDELAGETEKLDISVEKVEVEKVEKEAPAPVPVEPEDNTMTLAQWKAQQTVTENAFNVRKVHATKAMKVIPTKLDYTSEEEHVIVERRAPKKQMVNIDINFAKSRDGGEREGGRGGRGGRGGSRGDFGGRGRGEFSRGPRGGDRGEYVPRGGRGGGRGGSTDVRGGPSGQRQAGGRALQVDDLNSFPALG